MTQEINIHRSVRHKHIVEFYSFFEDSENVYILLELCRRRVSFMFCEYILIWYSDDTDVRIKDIVSNRVFKYSCIFFLVYDGTPQTSKSCYRARVQIFC